MKIWFLLLKSSELSITVYCYIGEIPSKIQRTAVCLFGVMEYNDDQETAIKCDLSMDRLNKELAPARSLVCPTGCMSWGETKALSDNLVREALPQQMK